jgi:DNA-binding Lrp family transcriptional regulator
VKVNTWANSLDDSKGDLQQFAPPILTRLDLSDLTLVHHLTVDARKPQKALSRELHLPEYEISRRLKSIFEKQILSSFEVVLGRKLFRIGPLTLFHSHCDIQTTRAIATGIRKLPFQSWIFPANDGFLFFAALPSYLFTEIANVIMQRSKTVDIMWIDYDTSLRYYFDQTAFDEKKRIWNASREFTIEEPISALKKTLVKRE